MRSKLDELARAVMIGLVFYHLLISVFSLFHWELRTTLNAHSTLAYSQHQHQATFDDTMTLLFIVATPNSSHSEHFDLRRTNHNRGKMKEKENKDTNACGLFQLD